MALLLKFVPNSLSVFRVLLLIPLFHYIKISSNPGIISFSLIIIATDYLDGLLARKWNVISDLGRILDPVADKICIAAVGTALTIYRGFPVALLVALIFRDVLILSAGLFSIVKLNDMPVSNIIGKITVGVLSICLLVFLFDFGFLKPILVIAASVMIPASLVSYGLKISRLYKIRKKSSSFE